jgi:hypothetical protein
MGIEGVFAKTMEIPMKRFAFAAFAAVLALGLAAAPADAAKNKKVGEKALTCDDAWALQSVLKRKCKKHWSVSTQEEIKSCETTYHNFLKARKKC